MDTSWKWLWSVDFSPQGRSSLARQARYLAAWQRRAPALVVQPAHVASPIEPEKARQAGQAVLTRLCKSGPTRLALEPLRVASQEDASVSRDVQALWDLARSAQARGVVVGSRHLGSVAKFFLGSFSETLVYRAQGPVFVLPPKLPSRLSTLSRDRVVAVFATDLSDASERAFEQLLPWFALARIELVIVHAGGALLSHAIRRQPNLKAPYVESSRARLAPWVTRAQGAGVSASIVIDVDSKLEPAEAVIRAARKSKASLIATGAGASASQLGQVWQSLLVGSVARKILRLSPLPVCVAGFASAQR